MVCIGPFEFCPLVGGQHRLRGFVTPESLLLSPGLLSAAGLGLMLAIPSLSMHVRVPWSPCPGLERGEGHGSGLLSGDILLLAGLKLDLDGNWRSVKMRKTQPLKPTLVAGDPRRKKPSDCVWY